MKRVDAELLVGEAPAAMNGDIGLLKARLLKVISHSGSVGGCRNGNGTGLAVCWSV